MTAEELRSSDWMSGGCSSDLAILAGATLLLGLHDGVERATVASLFPAAEGPVLVLDAGANVDCSSRELVNFAHLGPVYMRDVLGRPAPPVGPLGRAAGRERVGQACEIPGGAVTLKKKN